MKICSGEASVFLAYLAEPSQLFHRGISPGYDHALFDLSAVRTMITLPVPLFTCFRSLVGRIPHAMR